LGVGNEQVQESSRPWARLRWLQRTKDSKEPEWGDILTDTKGESSLKKNSGKKKVPTKFKGTKPLTAGGGGNRETKIRTALIREHTKKNKVLSKGNKTQLTSK